MKVAIMKAAAPMTGGMSWLPVAEQADGLFAAAGLQQPADAGGADGAAVNTDLRDDVAADTEFPALLLQPRRVALPAVAEVKIVTADHMLRMQLPDQIILHKDLPRHVHHRLVKVGEDHPLHAAEPAHEQLPLRHGVEQRHGRAEHERVRVRVKAQRSRGQPQRLRALPRPVEKRGVAQVDAVKKAQRQNAVMYQVCSPRKSS